MLVAYVNANHLIFISGIKSDYPLAAAKISSNSATQPAQHYVSLKHGPVLVVQTAS